MTDRAKALEKLLRYLENEIQLYETTGINPLDIEHLTLTLVRLGLKEPKNADNIDKPTV